GQPPPLLGCAGRDRPCRRLPPSPSVSGWPAGPWDAPRHRPSASLGHGSRSPCSPPSPRQSALPRPLAASLGCLETSLRLGTSVDSSLPDYRPIAATSGSAPWSGSLG